MTAKTRISLPLLVALCCWMVGVASGQGARRDAAGPTSVSATLVRPWTATARAADRPMHRRWSAGPARVAPAGERRLRGDSDPDHLRPPIRAP
jgi:hypothetical protein